MVRSDLFFFLGGGGKLDLQINLEDLEEKDREFLKV